MPSARIYHFPKAARRRSIPRVSPRYDGLRYSQPGSAGFGLLLIVTLLAAFLYLTEAFSIARHDALYAALLAMVWGFYFSHDKLLETRVGPLLMLAGRLLLIAAVIGFFGVIYGLILSPQG